MVGHTILGAGGVIAREISRALPPGTVTLRQVSRSPERVHESDEVLSADLLNAESTERAVADSDVAYLVVGLKYDAAVWQEQWPRVVRNAIAACKRRRCRLVFFDNVYAYGRTLSLERSSNTA